ncbi:hypothetical protein INR49_012720, partial [Caranx melampygus]
PEEGRGGEGRSELRHRGGRGDRFTQGAEVRSQNRHSSQSNFTQKLKPNRATWNHSEDRSATLKLLHGQTRSRGGSGYYPEEYSCTGTIDQC